MALFDTLEDTLRKRRQERVADYQSVMAANARAASTPEQQAGAGIGNLLGALAIKYFGKDVQPTQQELQREQARKTLFDVPTEQTVQTTTPDGGMRTETKPVEMNEVQQLNFRGDKFLDYAQQYGDKDAFTIGLNFKQQAVAAAEKERKQKAELAQRKSIAGLADKYQLGEEGQTAAMTGVLDISGISTLANLNKDKGIETFVQETLDDKGNKIAILRNKATGAEIRKLGTTELAQVDAYKQQSVIGELLADREVIAKKPPSPERDNALAAIDAELTNQRLIMQGRKRDYAMNLLKDVKKTDKMSEINNPSVQIKLVSDLYDNYNGDDGAIRKHLNDYFTEDFKIKEELVENGYVKEIIPQDGTDPFYYDTRTNKFVAWKDSEIDSFF